MPATRVSTMWAKPSFYHHMGDILILILQPGAQIQQPDSLVSSLGSTICKQAHGKLTSLCFLGFLIHKLVIQWENSQNSMRKYFEVLLRIVAGKCWGFPGDTVVKNLPDPCVKKIPWSRKWQPTLVFLPGKFQWQRSLAGYSPWGHKESDTTEHTQQQKSKRCISLLNKIITKWEPGQKRKLGKHSLGQFGEIWLSFFFSPLTIAALRISSPFLP